MFSCFKKNIIRKKFDKYDEFLFKYLNKSNIKLIDVGAHKGFFVDLINKKMGVSEAILIEPLEKSFEVLLKKYSNKKGWIILKNVISDKNNKEVKFFINSSEETSSLLKIKTMEELEDVDTVQKEELVLKTKTLDSICLENNFNAADLIKIDVQGAEHLVLKGGAETIKNSKIVWIENSFKPLYEKSSIFNDIYQMMGDLGFYLAEISPGHKSMRGELLQVDALYINNKYIK